MNDIVGEKKISTKVGYNYYEAYCFIDEEMGIFLYTYFEDNVPEYLTKEELTEHFKPILRKDKLNKIIKETNKKNYV
jgi:hypothetical protein